MTTSRASYPLTANRTAGLISALAFWLVCLGIGALPTPALAASELLMFDERGCPWCQKWRDEIGPIYPKSPEGRRAPLRTIDIHGARPPGLRLNAPVRATPTFVLIDNNREIGRITGYPGEDFFWSLLGELIRKLPSEEQPRLPQVVPISAGNWGQPPIIADRY